MDLTDRGVEGRAPPKPLDVFLTTERGIYRVGETVYATALVRDATARAVENVPLTAIVTRPDGKEHSRVTLTDEGLGGNVTPINLAADAMRGTWRIGVYADVKGSPLAETTFLVEDFEPERLDFDLCDERRGDRSRRARRGQRRRPLPLRRAGRESRRRGRDGAERRAHARPVSGLHLRPCRGDLRHGGRAALRRDHRRFRPRDAADHASRRRPRPACRSRATVNVRVIDTSGTPVERSKTLPVAGEADRVGIKPLFDGAAGENSPVAFEVIAVDKSGRARSRGQSELVALRDPHRLPMVPRRRTLELRGRWRPRAASPTARSTSPPTARRRSRLRSNGAATGWRSRATGERSPPASTSRPAGTSRRRRSTRPRP